MKKIYLGSDHAGFSLKQALMRHLAKRKIAFADLGNEVLDPQDDYPIYGEKVAREVAKTKSKGILICGSSYGVCIVANKIKGVRAVSVITPADAKLSREHNDANVLCLSGWNLDSKAAVRIVEAFLRTKTSDAARHRRRRKQIAAIETNHLRS